MKHLFIVALAAAFLCGCNKQESTHAIGAGPDANTVPSTTGPVGDGQVARTEPSAARVTSK